MSLSAKNIRAARRTNRTRATVRGSEARPRMSVRVSNRHITVQIINDETGKTLASTSTIGKKSTGPLSEQAVKIGEAIATAAKKAGVERVVLDRGAKRYHGRIKALTDAAREKGLEV